MLPQTDVSLLSPISDISPTENRVVLADGSHCELNRMTSDEMFELQWQQERAFARQILEAPKGSAKRTEVTVQAYNTVTQIFATRVSSVEPLVLGRHPRHERMVLRLLARQQRRGIKPNFFEIGYATGGLLGCVAQAGYPTAGIEISAAMRDEASRNLGPECQVDLLVGNFLEYEFNPIKHRFSLIYWNDVFEHIAPDEILDFLEKIHSLLLPGGQLVTITPNWYIRPCDITRAFVPIRTEATGLHLKEYSLRETTALLRRAGFKRVATPLFVTSQHMALWGNGLASMKRLFEPILEHLPFPLTFLLCRGFALNTTIATR